MEECPRTLALYRPGVPMGIGHHYAYSGEIPCTGRLCCTLCGADAPEQRSLLGPPLTEQQLGKLDRILRLATPCRCCP